MHKSYLFSILLSLSMISFVSCSNDEDVVGSQKKDPIHIEKYQISQADARNYVLDDVLNSNVFAETKSSGDYYISSDSVMFLDLIPEVHTKSVLSHLVPVYVFNLSSQENTEAGFVVISGDRRTTPVLMKAESGRYNEETPFMQIVKDNLPYVLAGEIESTELLIDSLLNKGKIQTKSTVVVRDSIYPISNTKYIKTVGPITSTKWGQRAPYNYKMPNDCYETQPASQSPAGCVAVAVGQIMAYYRYPSTYNYNDMMNGYACYSGSIPVGSTQYNKTRDAVSQLMYDIGVGVDMNYGCSSGAVTIGTYGKTGQTYLQSLGYTCTSFTPNIINTYLSKNKPILVSGRDPGEGGHAWVIDGYELYMTEMRYQAWYSNGSTDFVDYTQDSYTVHCEWGWNNLYNGYYVAGVFNPSKYHFVNDIKYLFPEKK